MCQHTQESNLIKDIRSVSAPTKRMKKAPRKLTNQHDIRSMMSALKRKAEKTTNAPFPKELDNDQEMVNVESVESQEPQQDQEMSDQELQWEKSDQEMVSVESVEPQEPQQDPKVSNQETQVGWVKEKLNTFTNLGKPSKKKVRKLGHCPNRGGGLNGGVVCPNLLIWLLFLERQNFV